MADETTPPTDDEVAAANAVLARRAQAEIEARKAKMRPLVAIVHGDDFAALNRALSELPSELTSDPAVFPHLNAIRTGMNGLMTVSPSPVA